MPRARLPSPDVPIAIVAIALTGTGFAVAAIPDSKGVIRACYAKNGGALRVAQGGKCRKGERQLAWNLHGQTGLKRVFVRTRNMVLHYDACTPTGGGSYTCSHPQTTDTSPCKLGERAAGGGFGRTNDGTYVSVLEDRPTAQAGRPAAWLLTVAASSVLSNTDTHADTLVPIHTACTPR